VVHGTLLKHPTNDQLYALGHAMQAEGVKLVVGWMFEQGRFS
jgi:hypothetical protein